MLNNSFYLGYVYTVPVLVKNEIPDFMPDWVLLFTLCGQEMLHQSPVGMHENAVIVNVPVQCKCSLILLEVKTALVALQFCRHFESTSAILSIG